MAPAQLTRRLRASACVFMPLHRPGERNTDLVNRRTVAGTADAERGAAGNECERFACRHGILEDGARARRLSGPLQFCAYWLRACPSMRLGEPRWARLPACAFAAHFCLLHIRGIHLHAASICIRSLRLPNCGGLRRLRWLRRPTTYHFRHLGRDRVEVWGCCVQRCAVWVLHVSYQTCALDRSSCYTAVGLRPSS